MSVLARLISEGVVYELEELDTSIGRADTNDIVRGLRAAPVQPVCPCRQCLDSTACARA